MKDIITVILAAGRGTRMVSNMGKLIHELCGQPLVKYVIDASVDCGIKRNIIIIGHNAEEVKEVLGDNFEYVVQKEQAGTGHALMQASRLLKDFEGDLLVLPGDDPFLNPNILKSLISQHKKTHASVTILTAVLPDPGGYGRIVRGHDGEVTKIVERKDAHLREIELREVNSGVYCFNCRTLQELLPELDRRNTQGEYYLTDVIGLMFGRNLRVETVVADDPTVVLGVNNRCELAQALRIFRERILEKLMLSGVTIMDPASTFIDSTVKVGQDTVIYPYTVIERNCAVGKNCTIGPHVHLIKTKVGNSVRMESSVVEGSVIPDNTRIVPYSYIKGKKH
jgi:bifunctional UDP-N-acetylglucosamine pyrophosphorylase/glucosamine-1-phosphate N-acetyltransferase